MAPAKFASLDWPPPPSPTFGGSSQAGLGATSPGPAAAAFGLEGRASASRPELRARADLWAVRAEIDREKLRCVAPYPFFGRAMRFQDEFSALQITEDGRFSYSTLSFEASDSLERAASAAEGEKTGRRVITYEGVFTLAQEPDGSSPMAGGLILLGGTVGAGTVGAAAGAGPGAEETDKAEAPEVASIEGKALVCHIIEERGGRTRLESVQPGVFRFAITVSPFYQPASATVLPLVQPRSPGRPPPRRRNLPYVGTGSAGSALRRSASQIGAASPIAVAAMMNVATGAELRQHKRRGPRLKFSRSSATLPMSRQDDGRASFNASAASILSSGDFSAMLGRSSPTAVYTPAGMPRAGSMQTSSAPQLPTLRIGGKDVASPTVADWRDFYRERAKALLGTEGG